MYIHKKDLKLITFIAVCSLALFSLPAKAGAPQGHLDSIESQLKMKIADGFEYLGRGNESRFSEVAKSFLWDHRELIQAEKVSKSRQADAIVCILIAEYERPGFEMYQDSDQFVEWCQGLIRE